MLRLSCSLTDFGMGLHTRIFSLKDQPLVQGFEPHDGHDRPSSCCTMYATVNGMGPFLCEETTSHGPSVPRGDAGENCGSWRQVVVD